MAQNPKKPAAEKAKDKVKRMGALPAGLLDGQLAQSIKDSAQQIWLAGLGAFAKTQGDGNKVFETLMNEGLSLHRRTQAAAEEKISGVTNRVSAMAGQANAQWDKLETIFEQRTARALGRLGVPTARDVAALTERVDALAAAVAALGGEPTPRPARKTARTPAKAPTKAAVKATAKKAPASKTARAAKAPSTSASTAPRRTPAKRPRAA